MDADESPSSSKPWRIVGPDAVHRATDAAHHFSRAEGIGSGDAMRLGIIIEELVTNLYEHGGVAGDEIVELMLARKGETVAVVIIDPGTAFDPRRAVVGDVPPDRGGGAGIGLVKAWAEIVDYGSADGRNRLDLRLKLGNAG